MKHNRFEKVSQELLHSGCNPKYRVHNHKRLQSYRLLRQDRVIYDTREPRLRRKSVEEVLETLAAWEVPERGYLRSWKYRKKGKQWEKDK